MSDGLVRLPGTPTVTMPRRDRVAGHVEHRATDERAQVWRHPGGIECLVAQRDQESNSDIRGLTCDRLLEVRLLVTQGLLHQIDLHRDADAALPMRPACAANMTRSPKCAATFSRR